MFCGNCGNKLEIDDKFCSSCGKACNNESSVSSSNPFYNDSPILSSNPLIILINKYPIPAIAVITLVIITFMGMIVQISGCSG